MFKKIILTAILFLGITSIFSGCSLNNKNNQESNNAKIKVAASIFPIYDITKEIAGDKIDVNLILPPGASPHTFEVSASQIKNLQNTKLFFVNGQNLDSWVENISSSVSGSQTIDLSEVVDLQQLDENNPNHRPDEEDSGFDPHYWLNPKNVYAVSEEILNQLVVLSPEDEQYFLGNYNNFVNELQSKDTEWKDKMNSLLDKNIFVFHDAWGYFADSFDLTIVGTFEPFPGQEPTPKYLKELQTAVKENNIKTLFVEPQLSQSSIKTLASDLGVQIEVLDPLGGVEGRMSYIEMMDFNVNNVYGLLK
ncbi:MAG: hypothetical protein COX80_03275 [Candidatus Magasanikbacteria bacterium CG_4_10_14_0_2_um_filter_33_14]|uniref:Zinc ABC transporter substrate-binding protein n=1 Tax=Candidatus Magasanikbacteria bacterium CG_4_10_14_0_2_um_filter_33_14 TaxID=1974636 RepID=A0A2M7VAR7_9BACT|nr:MAG: hypothetical protein COX80_03275 [Candidatus Magasanikbacteria bacterium CG_4_10_14_0_2_um_filter_33_14]